MACVGNWESLSKEAGNNERWAGKTVDGRSKEDSIHYFKEPGNGKQSMVVCKEVTKSGFCFKWIIQVTI